MTGNCAGCTSCSRVPAINSPWSLRRHEFASPQRQQTFPAVVHCSFIILTGKCNVVTLMFCIESAGTCAADGPEFFSHFEGRHALTVPRDRQVPTEGSGHYHVTRAL